MRAARRDAARSYASLEPEVVVADILTVAAALAAELEERPWATLVPHVLPTGGAGLPGVLGRRASIRARAPASGCGGCARPLLMRGEAQGRDELNGARDAGRAAAARPRARRHLAPAGARRHVPAARVPAPPSSPSLRPPARCCGSSRSARSSSPPGDDPLCSSRRAPPRTRSTGCCGPRSRAWRDEPVRVLATTNRRPPPRPLPSPPNARARRLGLLRAHDAACAAVVCHAGHGTLARALACGVPRGCLPARRRHGRERRPRPLGRRRRVAPAPLPHAARPAPRGPPPARRPAATPRRAARLREWSERHDGAALAADALEELTSAPDVYPHGVNYEPWQPRRAATPPPRTS